MILYNDEAQAGNLLSVDSDKKASLWYFSLREVGWRWCDVVWHPICLIQHNEIEQVVGGFSAVARSILRRILDEDLHLGFPISLPNNRTTLLKCDVKWMISDLDSVRAALSLKGSSAIRCCLFCKNAVKKHSNLEEIDDYFQDITSANLDGFHEQSDANIFELWIFFLSNNEIYARELWKKKEQAAGFNYSDAAWLSDRTVREAVLPWCFLLDTMHMYWSNGIVSWEVNAIYRLWQEEKVGNLVDFMSLDWKTSSGQSNTLSWRKKIQRSKFYSCSIQRWFEQPPVFFSNFSSFHRRFFGVARTMHWCPWKHAGFAPHHHGAAENHARGSSRLGAFAATQILHHSLTRAAFGYDHIRPKHHARFHLPKQLKQSGFHADCFPGEKNQAVQVSHWLTSFWPLTKSKDGQFSHFVLLEMWKHYLEALRKFTFSNYLIGAKKPDPSTGTLLNSTICHVSPSLQYMGAPSLQKMCCWVNFLALCWELLKQKTFFSCDSECWRWRKLKSFIHGGPPQTKRKLYQLLWQEEVLLVGSWNRAAFALLALKKVVTCFCTHKLYTLRHIVPQICVPVWNGIILNNISMDILCSCIFLNIYLAAQGVAITVCYLLLTWKHYRCM